MSLLQDSHWGDLAGRSLIIAPLYWISFFALCAYLFRRNLLFLVGTQLLLVLGFFPNLGLQRLIFVPIVLLALAALLERSTWPRAAALMVVSIGEVVLVPETAIFSGAAWAVVFIRDLAAWRAWGPYDEPWARTVRCLVAGALTGAAAAVVLAALGALDEYIDFMTTYGSDYELVAGIPFQWDANGFAYRFWVFATPGVILVAWWYAAARIGSRRWFSNRDLVVGAAVIGVLPYYTKFLSRADGHVFNPASIALIPLMYIVYRLVMAAEERLRHRGGRWTVIAHPLTAALIAVFVLIAPRSATDVLREAPTRFAGTAHAAPYDPRVGYTTDTELAGLIPRAKAAINRYAGEDGRIFDLTNSPGLFYYIPDRDPATRYIESTTAVRESTQEDLVSELDDARPPLVVYTSRVNGFSTWDGISGPVRNYLVSDWLLDHYKPVGHVADYVLLAPEESDRPAYRAGYFETPPCAWGDTPNFFDQAPEPGADSAPLPVSQAGPGIEITGHGWAGNPETGRPARQVLLADGDRVIARIPTGVPRPDVGQALGLPSLATSGYEFADLILPVDPSSAELRFFGVNEDGVASQLGPPTDPPSALRLDGGSRIEVREGAVRGSIDAFEATPLSRYRLDPPADFQAYDWLRVTARDEIGDTSFVVSDGGSHGARTISFNAIDGAQSELVRVGSCPQWKGYASGPLYLDVTPRTGPLEAELVR